MFVVIITHMFIVQCIEAHKGTTFSHQRLRTTTIYSNDGRIRKKPKPKQLSQTIFHGIKLALFTSSRYLFCLFMYCMDVCDVSKISGPKWTELKPLMTSTVVVPTNLILIKINQSIYLQFKYQRAKRPKVTQRKCICSGNRFYGKKSFSLEIPIKQTLQLTERNSSNLKSEKIKKKERLL